MATDDQDDARFALSSPQAHVLALAKAQLDNDHDVITEIFELIERGGLWQLVTVIAVAELTEALRELHGDDAGARHPQT